VRVYCLSNRLSAVALNDEYQAIGLAAGSIVKLVGKSRRVRGLVEVKSGHESYAVFLADLEERGVLIGEEGQAVVVAR
jgi:hypothetical protein